MRTPSPPLGSSARRETRAHAHAHRPGVGRQGCRGHSPFRSCGCRALWSSLHAWQTHGTGGALVSQRWGPKFQLCYRYWRSPALASALASMFPAPSRRPVTAGAAAGLRGNTSGPHTRFPCFTPSPQGKGRGGPLRLSAEEQARRGTPASHLRPSWTPAPSEAQCPRPPGSRVVSSTPQGICLQPPPVGGHWLFGRR